MVVFEADYDEIKLQNSYDVISVTSSPMRHRKTSLKFFQFWAPLNQNFWLRQWS